MSVGNELAFPIPGGDCGPGDPGMTYRQHLIAQVAPIAFNEAMACIHRGTGGAPLESVFAEYASKGIGFVDLMIAMLDAESPNE